MIHDEGVGGSRECEVRCGFENIFEGSAGPVEVPEGAAREEVVPGCIPAIGRQPGFWEG